MPERLQQQLQQLRDQLAQEPPLDAEERASLIELMQEIELQLPPAPDQPQALLAHYQQVNNELVQLWQLQGHHAYFHHLSALFGYRALLMRF